MNWIVSSSISGSLVLEAATIKSTVVILMLLYTFFLSCVYYPQINFCERQSRSISWMGVRRDCTAIPYKQKVPVKRYKSQGNLAPPPSNQVKNITTLFKLPKQILRIAHTQEEWKDFRKVSKEINWGMSVKFMYMPVH